MTGRVRDRLVEAALVPWWVATASTTVAVHLVTVPPWRWVWPF